MKIQSGFHNNMGFYVKKKGLITSISAADSSNSHADQNKQSKLESVHLHVGTSAMITRRQPPAVLYYEAPTTSADLFIKIRKVAVLMRRGRQFNLLCHDDFLLSQVINCRAEMQNRHPTNPVNS